MKIEPEEARRVLREADLLHSEQTLHAELDRMAAAITDKLEDRNPLLLCVLTGGIVPMGHLLTRLRFPLQIDYLHATRYRGTTRGGELHWIARPALPLQGRTVLVVDDILDEGLTLQAILAFCREQGAREVYSAVLVDKQLRKRAADVSVDFTGVQVADRYVFGFGMDYHGYHRNLPAIYAVRDEA